MARTVAVSSLLLRLRDLADIDNDDAFDDARLIRFLASSYTWLYDLLADIPGYFESDPPQSIVTTGVASYSLPADHYRTLRVDYQIANGEWRRVKEADIREIHRFEASTGSYAARFRLVGQKLYLYPTPPSGQTYRHIYVPAATVLDDTADTIDGVSGWEELLVLDAVIKARIKDDTALEEVFRERSIHLKRIEDMRIERLAASTKSVFGEDEEDFLELSEWELT